MHNLKIIKLIEDLKGRRSYEEKRASKLGFSSLYAYFEDKILSEQKAIKDRKKKLGEISSDNKSENTEKKSCSCC